jgi:hypothetical protein
MGIVILLSQQLKKAVDSLHYRVDAIAGFKMDPDNSNPTLQSVWFEQSHLDGSIAERKNSFLRSHI